VKLGLIGAGNMAGALARGWGEPVLVTDVDAEKADALAAALGGTAVPTASQLAEQADVVVLCHKPAQLEDVAKETEGKAKAVVSILGGVPVAAVEAAYPDTPVYRFMPNVAAEVRRGVLCYSPGSRASDGPEQEVLDLFGRLGTVFPMGEAQMETATAVMSCAPAWLALVAEALVDAGVRHGLQRAEAEQLVAQTVAGTGELLAAAGHSPAEVRRRVTSPGGLTARGLAALEARGVRAAFDAAVDAVVERR
jgi:pyrroline-5-carboxylate reductase